jgi:hypothetical protein
MDRECIMHDRNRYKGLVGKPENKRPLGIISCRWEYNIKMNLIYVWCM